jgi:pilus assembly protein Flp/PilA
MQGMTNLARDQRGATSIEYGLIAALMAVVVIACMAALGPSMRQGLVKIGGEMSTPQDVTD